MTLSSFITQGGVDTNLPNGGIYIRSLVPGGAAERDGRLHSSNTAKHHIQQCLMYLWRTVFSNWFNNGNTTNV